MKDPVTEQEGLDMPEQSSATADAEIAASSTTPTRVPPTPVAVTKQDLQVLAKFLTPPEEILQNDIRYPSFWRRSLASLIDVLLLLLINSMLLGLLNSLQVMLLRMVYFVPSSYIHLFYSDIPGIIMLLTILFCYCVFLDCSHWQGTIGKRIVGIKVVHAQGYRLRFKQAFKRFAIHVGGIYLGCIPVLFPQENDLYETFSTFLYILMGCNFYFLFMTHLWPALSSQKQTLHDRLAGTQVIMR